VSELPNGRPGAQPTALSSALAATQAATLGTAQRTSGLTSKAMARLIALDWGTSNLRASLLGDGGAVIETRAAPGGVMAVPERRFEPALMALAGDWIRELRCPLIASGMIGSRQGWQEAPYLDCPAGIASAAARLLQIPLLAGATLHIAPGLSCTGADGQADVMRGEETQLWGAELPAGTCCVLPGTHAKWAWMGQANTVQTFQTYMTGELYALLTQHGILGRLMQFGTSSPAAFQQGVALGLKEHANALHVVFAARTAGLMGRLTPQELPDFLSGILIGVEIGSATRHSTPAAVSVLGDAGLAARYETALHTAGIITQRVPEHATTRGQWLLAQQAGLVTGLVPGAVHRAMSGVLPGVVPAPAPGGP
jgi:2-dehydro-3-deoxygalactonokinase